MRVVELSPIGHGRFGRARSLADLAEDLEQAAAELRVSARSPRGASLGRIVGRDAVGRCPPDALSMAEMLHRERAKRSTAFPSLSAEGWDMLLMLFVEEARGRRLSLLALCSATCGAETTALRHLRALISAGLIRRVADRNDRRRHFVVLSSEASLALKAHLDQLVAANDVTP